MNAIGTGTSRCANWPPTLRPRQVLYVLPHEFLAHGRWRRNLDARHLSRTIAAPMARRLRTVMRRRAWRSWSNNAVHNDLWLETFMGLYHSTDAGDSWQEVLGNSGRPHQRLRRGAGQGERSARRRALHLYYWSGDWNERQRPPQDCGIYRSTDAGKSWDRIADGRPASSRMGWAASRGSCQLGYLRPGRPHVRRPGLRVRQAEVRGTMAQAQRTRKAT